MPKKGDITRGK